MVMMTVTPADASPARMSTTLAALLLSSPAHQGNMAWGAGLHVCTLAPGASLASSHTPHRFRLDRCTTSEPLLGLFRQEDMR